MTTLNQWTVLLLLALFSSCTSPDSFDERLKSFGDKEHIFFVINPNDCVLCNQMIEEAFGQRFLGKIYHKGNTSFVLPSIRKVEQQQEKEKYANYGVPVLFDDTLSKQLRALANPDILSDASFYIVMKARKPILSESLKNIKYIQELDSIARLQWQ